MAKPRIGFIGLGIMGKPMSGHLLAAGYELVVHDVNRAAVAEVAAAGAAAAESASEVARRTDLVITMLPDSPDVEAVALGPGGLLEAARPGVSWIDMSTIAPSTAIRLAGELSSRGVRCLDAPVSGGDVGARNATLSIMVGGDEAVFGEVLPVFQALGKNIVLCGPAGAGQIVKACNQVLVAVTIAGVSEALVLGAKAGVDPLKIAKVLGAGLARCGILENRGQRMVNGDFAPGFRIRLHHKDLNIIMKTGNDYQVPLPVTSVVHELFTAAMGRGRGELDHTGLLTVLEDLAGTEARTGA
jgi:2-hydroxy-3-oxopropionate reductase